MSLRERALSGALLVGFVLVVHPGEAWLLGIAALLAPFAAVPERTRTFLLTAVAVMALVALSGDPLPLGVLGVVLLIDALRSSGMALRGIRF